MLAISEVVNILKNLAKNSSNFTRPTQEIAVSSVSYEKPQTVSVSVNQNPPETVSQEKRVVGGVDTKVLDQAVQRLVSYVREVVRGVIVGDKSSVESNVEYFRGFLSKIRQVYGDSGVYYVLTKLKSIVGDQLIRLLVGGSVDDLVSLRGDLVTAYVVARLRNKGVKVSPESVRRVVAQTKLDVRKLAETIMEGVNKLMQYTRRPYEMGDVKRIVDEVRSAMAVGMGVSGEDFLKLLKRSFSGEKKEVIDVLAKSVTKPMSPKELINVVSKSSSRAVVAHGKLLEIKEGGRGIDVTPSTSADANTIERVKRVMETMKSS